MAPIVLLPSSATSELFTWVDAEGTEHALTDAAGYRVLYGVGGRWSQPITYVEDQVPMMPGSIMLQPVVGARDVDLPMLITGSSISEVYGRLRNLARWVDGSRADGPGTLKCQAPDGEVRTLTAYGHIEAGESSQERFLVAMRISLTLRCPDPFWYAEDDDSTTFELGDVGYPFFPFSFPFRVPSSTVLGATTIENVGDVTAWPVWTITGPGQDPVMRNRDTGEMVGVSIELDAGDVLTIDTRPGIKTVEDAGGTNYFGSLFANSSLWSLPPGMTNVQIEMSGATAASSVVVSWRPRYWTP